LKVICPSLVLGQDAFHLQNAEYLKSFENLLFLSLRTGSDPMRSKYYKYGGPTTTHNQIASSKINKSFFSYLQNKQKRDTNHLNRTCSTSENQHQDLPYPENEIGTI
jgi:hypothetical protein